MATRQDFQIAQDLIRFVNITNDLLDVASFSMRDLDPDGAPLRDSEGNPYTFQMIKDELVKTRQNIMNYWSMIDVFIDTYGLTNVATALNSVSVDASVVRQELNNIKDVINYVQTNLAGLTTKVELLPLADYVDAHVDKLPLVRRSWCLGI